MMTDPSTSATNGDTAHLERATGHERRVFRMLCSTIALAFFLVFLAFGFVTQYITLENQAGEIVDGVRRALRPSPWYVPSLRDDKLYPGGSAMLADVVGLVGLLLLVGVFALSEVFTSTRRWILTGVAALLIATAAVSFSGLSAWRAWSTADARVGERIRIDASSLEALARTTKPIYVAIGDDEALMDDFRVGMIWTMFDMSKFMNEVIANGGVEGLAEPKPDNRRLHGMTKDELIRIGRSVAQPARENLLRQFEAQVTQQLGRR